MRLATFLRGGLAAAALALVPAALAMKSASDGSLTHASSAAPAPAAPGPAPPVAEPSAADPAPRADRAVAAASAPAPAIAAAGMRVAIDPETGTLVPDRTVVEPEAAAAPTVDALVTEPLPQGGYIMHVEGHFMEHAVATIGPDGRVHLDCVTDEAMPAWRRHAHVARSASRPAAAPEE